MMQMFSCLGCQGNSTTLGSRPQELGLDVREELKKFHSAHYSANLMRLAVIGRGGECHGHMTLTWLSCDSTTVDRESGWADGTRRGAFLTNTEQERPHSRVPRPPILVRGIAGVIDQWVVRASAHLYPWRDMYDAFVSMQPTKVLIRQKLQMPQYMYIISVPYHYLYDSDYFHSVFHEICHYCARNSLALLSWSTGQFSSFSS